MNESNIVIKAEHVSKKFCRFLRTSMVYGIKDIARNALGLSSRPEVLRKGEFWAVDDVSFDLKKGEVLGIIGPNGSGKTTMLKMINGIFWPDRGKITINGKVGALIQVGAGFHEMLTGRENIYINAAILGMSKEETDKKFDAIVEFADIGDFLDTPVKFYSSGMFVRLGFAVAVHCEPDILLVDEVLAVGDLEFRTKCYNKISDLLDSCAVVLVSHDMAAVARIASRCLVLNQSHPVFYGSAQEAIPCYTALSHKEKGMLHEPVGSGEARIDSLKLCDKNNKDCDDFFYGDLLTVAFDAKVDATYDSFLISMSFTDSAGQLVAQCHSENNGISLKNNGKTKKVQITIPKLEFNPGIYGLTLIVFDKTNKKYLAWYHRTKKFKVTGDFIGAIHHQLLGAWKIDETAD